MVYKIYSDYICSGGGGKVAVVLVFLEGLVFKIVAVLVVEVVAVEVAIVLLVGDVDCRDIGRCSLSPCC